MANGKLFGNRIPPACRYCESALGGVGGDESVLCARKGVVARDYQCRRYIYDPLKRIPKPAPELREFQESDFSLELEPSTAAEGEGRLESDFTWDEDIASTVGGGDEK